MDIPNVLAQDILDAKLTLKNHGFYNIEVIPYHSVYNSNNETVQRVVRQKYFQDTHSVELVVCSFKVTV